MISPKYIIGVVVLGILLGFGGAALEQQYLPAGSMLSIQKLISGNPALMIGGLKTLLFWDFPQFHGEWNLVRGILFALSGGILLYIITAGVSFITKILTGGRV